MSARTCEVCGERTALYLCQNCGSSICPVCRVRLLCRKCAADQESAGLGSGQPIKVGPVPLFAIAVAVILVGFVLLVLGSRSPAASGCFFWPLPLVVGCGFGSGEISALALFSVVALVAAVLAFWSLSLRWARLPP